MKIDGSLAVPPAPDGDGGPALATGFLVADPLVATVRGLVHVFAPDGSAQSIAGADVGVVGGPNTVFVASVVRSAESVA